MLPRLRLPHQALAAACAALGVAHIHAGDDVGHLIHQALEAHGAVPGALLVEWCHLQRGVAAARAALAASLPGLELVERHERSLRFRLPAAGTTLASLFAAIEAQRGPLGIEEYSVSQATLEQIFNQFAAQQEEEAGAVRGMAGAHAVGGAIQAIGAIGAATPL